MGLSTANRNDIAQVALSRIKRDVAAATHVYSGTLACLDSAGNSVPAADAANYIFDGIYESEVNNTGAAGALQALITPRADNKLGVIEVNAVSPDKTWLGQEVAISDDHTVALLGQTTHVVRCGRCVYIQKTGASGKVWVDTTDVATTANAGS